MRWSALDKEVCSVARAVSVVGDRWTLLILRDCFLRVRRFEAFQERLGITRHILADRLRKLVNAGVLDRVQYQSNPRRFEYRLTAKGVQHANEQFEISDEVGAAPKRSLSRA